MNTNVVPDGVRISARGRQSLVRDCTGFTLIEMLIAMAVMLLILAGVFQAFNPAQGSYRTQPEVADLQQRLRVGTDRLYNGLVVAGAGVYSGTAVGALGNFFAPILPYRAGYIDDDPSKGIYFRTGTPAGDYSTAITIYHVPTTASQTSIRQAMPDDSAELKVFDEPGCPEKDPLCGFKDYQRAIIFDDTGSYDVFTIQNCQSDAGHFNHHQEHLSKKYDVGAVVTQVKTDTYYWRQDAATNTFQLMHYDGGDINDPQANSQDIPLIDDVVDLRFEYLGEAAPPILRVPVTDPVGPWTSYGPKPPALGVKVGTWQPGENCTFKVDPGTGLQVPRLASLGPPGTLVPLTAKGLTDGPWCPDISSPNRYDADLHRIRQIRVTFRVQTGVAVLRGPAGVLFSRAGTARFSDRLVPDQAVQFDVTPRNLNLGR